MKKKTGKKANKATAAEQPRAAATTAAMVEQPIAAPQAVSVPLESAEQFFKTFEKSARRWEMVVYPGMFIVVMFMAYGFYLIYNITNDMRAMVSRFDDPEITTNLSTLSKNLQALNGNIAKMASRVDDMARDTSHMSANTAAMSKSTAEMTKYMESVKYMGSMDRELKKMNQSVYVMNYSVKKMGSDISTMRRDMSGMNRSVSRPLNMMNKFLPF